MPQKRDHLSSSKAAARLKKKIKKATNFLDILRYSLFGIAGGQEVDLNFS